MAITFTRTTRTYDPEAGTATVATTTITGNAIQVRGRPERYKALGLVLETMPTLLFTATDYGDTPQSGDTVTWPETNGSVYTVRDVETVAPDGVTILSRVVIAK